MGLRHIPNDINQPKRGAPWLRQRLQGSIGLTFIQKFILFVKSGVTLCWYLVALILAGFWLVNIYKIAVWFNRYMEIIFSKLPYWRG